MNTRIKTWQPLTSDGKICFVDVTCSPRIQGVRTAGTAGDVGSFGVYSRRRVVGNLEIFEKTADHPYVTYHELQENKVTKLTTASSTHWGLTHFFGDDPERMGDLPKRQEERDFYV